LQKYNEINQIDNTKRYLIDYANMKCGLIKYQSDFLDEKDLETFYKKPEFGFPLILPEGIACFDYKKNKNKFSVNKNQFREKIFFIRKKKYKPLLNFFDYGNNFCTGSVPKKKFNKLIKKINEENIKLKNLILKLKKKNKIIGAFQTRNIPHKGHEKIIQLLLKYCDIVIVNPVIGPKKRGDVRPEILKKIYNFLLRKYYGKNVIYRPVYANMHYAGPREAIHHTLIRESLGFDYFVVGRDHAGAEDVYEFNAAAKMVNKFKKNFSINIITHSGSFFCKTCNKIVIKDECNKFNCKLENISGTRFRKSILNKIYFKHARKNLQNFLRKFERNLFY